MHKSLVPENSVERNGGPYADRKEIRKAIYTDINR